MIRCELLGVVLILATLPQSGARVLQKAYLHDPSGRAGTKDYLSGPGSMVKEHSFLHLLDLEDRLTSWISMLENVRIQQESPPVGDSLFTESNFGEKEPVANWQNIPSYRTIGDDIDFGSLVEKRQRKCDTSRMTLQTLVEYLRTGRICGRRVAHVRFGLGGK